MLKHFITFQWKSFMRSASLGKDTAVKLIMAFFAVYMLGTLALLGAMSYPALQKLFPNVDPMLMFNRFVIYWFLGELFFRYFMQKLPVLDVKPLLVLPVSKSIISHFVLIRSGLSYYNFLGLFLFTPFAIVLLLNDYPALNTLIWLFSMGCIVVAVNYLNFIINKSDKILLLIAATVALLYAMEYFQVISVSQVAGKLFYSFYQNPIYCLIPLFLAILVYRLNFGHLKGRVFLDDSLGEKTKDAITSDLAWTRRFGDIAPFLQLDLKLIWRNKRTKVQTFMSLAMVFYGLVFYSMDDWPITSPLFVFVGIFVTGIFLMNFGQFIPAWDSEYYSMMMSQNIPLRKYLESKAGLIAVSVAGMFLLSIPYVYFGWQALAINFSCALYNLGINIPLILFFGSMNKKRIDLTKSALGNLQGSSATQFLVGIPLFGIPMVIYLGFYYLVSIEVALSVLAGLGILGFACRKLLLDKITAVYRGKKYAMIAGFKEKNS
ncbi:DUF5687 family protein [Spongiimicrobium sp. 3-5]|uniref:DUF5687 family protein n=1 Tax=Spongiimicrobium sp. 3-5 TaxID=3332596 RepID=UPI003980892E